MVMSRASAQDFWLLSRDGKSSEQFIWRNLVIAVWGSTNCQLEFERYRIFQSREKELGDCGYQEPPPRM
jgi:hypothetical protein